VIATGDRFSRAALASLGRQIDRPLIADVGPYRV